MAQEEQRVSAKRRPEDRRARQAFRALPSWSQQQQVSLQTARRVVSGQLVRRVSPGPAVLLQLAQQAQQELLVRQAWKE